MATSAERPVCLLGDRRRALAVSSLLRGDDLERPAPRSCGEARELLLVAPAERS